MIERLLSFLKDLPGGASGSFDGKDDPKVAAAALMIHVMDADGERQQSEISRLKETLSEHYDVHGQALEALFRAAEKADQEAIDLYAFTSVLKRHLDEKARAEFIGIMWDVVYADGEMHELEDNTVWRVAELIGVDSRERIALRQRAQREAQDGKIN
ncbi:TerB family tellurite resistance protein [Mesorhizobium sp. 1B3]|uniref:tellurite resistance TerB family protein n=1 Tax=Mesorhizobium sp. 1B3 TaxID=3243599 RepID=UPI003D98EDF1